MKLQQMAPLESIWSICVTLKSGVAATQVAFSRCGRQPSSGEGRAINGGDAGSNDHHHIAWILLQRGHTELQGQQACDGASGMVPLLGASLDPVTSLD